MSADPLKIGERPSPNHDGRGSAVVDMLVVHYTGMISGQAALQRLCDPAAKVSAHYLIDEDGTVSRLVDEDRRAWHAGVACWRGNSDINARSIGIELVNPGHEFGYRPFTPAQMDSLQALAAGILERHPIPARNVVGHADVAPARKEDPGELFAWERLAKAGIGLWPQPHPLDTWDVAAVQEMLARYGYCVEASGVEDEATRLVLRAFQRHFRPRRVDGRADSECAALLAGLMALLDGG